MGNITEGTTWTDKITQLETNDAVLGGPNGPANKQAIELSARTQYLKALIATINAELTGARGGKASLDERMDQYDAFNPENIATLQALIAAALDSAGLANREVLKTIRYRFQTGISVINNRGVVTGCTVSKSSSAIRNLSIAAGSFFANGLTIPCPGMNNSAIVTSNPGEAAQVCYGYVFVDSSGVVRFSVTEYGELVPDNGIAICRITVPAGNTQVSDPNLTSVTITDVRRIEAGYPQQVNSIAYASVAFPYNMLDTEYVVLVDVQGAKGGMNQRGTVYAGDKAANGFKLYSEGSIDSVSVRWIAIKLML
jgi:hypothetical protein